jgi:Domain of unknown function (DUF4249)
MFLTCNTILIATHNPMKLKHLSLTFFIIFALIIQSCIDPYEVNFTSKNAVLVVEGFLTDDYVNPDTIKIQYSNYNSEAIEITPVASVKASIVVASSGSEINLVEQKPGKFFPPKDFRIKASEKYFLRFFLPNGQKYESSQEQASITPPILKVYDKFNTQSRLKNDGTSFLSANEVYLDVQDVPNQKDYYLWRYTHFERTIYCATCNKSYYDGRTNTCSLPIQSYNRTPYYDYQCAGECYTFFKEKQVNVLSDVASDGKTITARQIAKIPVYNPGGCLIQIQQMSISPQMYLFYKTLESQTATGGLTDTPASAIVGNVSNLTNNTDKVIGYFGVVSIQKKNFWIDRKEAKEPYESLLGHVVSEESATPDLTRPPFAPCSKNGTRTPVRPEGWIK